MKTIGGRTSLRLGLLAGAATAALMGGMVSASAQASRPAAGTSGGSEATLEAITVEGQQPTYGTTGFVATRSTAGMKSNSSVLETPATVSVITREELDVRGVQDIETAVAYSPNVAVIDYPGGQGAPTFVLRGFQAINFENVYEDGLRYGFNPFDREIEPYAYERIDVIKGPASALYGAGLPGGFINLVSKRPTFTPQNEVFLQGGTFGRIQGGFDLSGPVEGHPEFAYRFTGLVRQSGTQVAFTPDDRVYLAPSFTWRPDADTSFTVLAKYMQSRGGGSEQALPIVGSIIPSIYGKYKPNVFIGQPNLNTDLVDNRSIGYILDHTFAPGWLYHSALRYTETDTKMNAVLFGSIFLGPNSAFDDTRRFFSGSPYIRHQNSYSTLADNHIEGQFDLLGVQHNVVVGVDVQSYIRRSAWQFSRDVTNVDIYNPVYNLNFNIPGDIDIATRQSLLQTGIYAQDQMKWNGFILTGSLRHDWASINTNNLQSTTVPVPNQTRKDETALSYRAALGYEFGNGVVPYVAYSTSFNPQLFGLKQGPVPGVGVPLDAITSGSIEGGVKYQPVGENALYTLSYFEITQTNVPAFDPNSAIFYRQTGEAVSKGIEFEAKATLAPGLNVIAGIAHIDTKITKDVNDNLTGVSLLGKKLPNVPENTVSVFVDYAFPFGNVFSGLRAGAGVRYVGRTYGPTNFFALPDYALVDASLSYDLSRLDPAWKGAVISVNALNLFDKRYFTASPYSGAPVAGGVSETPGYVFEGFRRQVYGTLTYRW